MTRTPSITRLSKPMAANRLDPLPYFRPNTLPIPAHPAPMPPRSISEQRNGREPISIDPNSASRRHHLSRRPPGGTGPSSRPAQFDAYDPAHPTLLVASRPRLTRVRQADPNSLPSAGKAMAGTSPRGGPTRTRVVTLTLTIARPRRPSLASSHPFPIPLFLPRPPSVLLMRAYPASWT